MWRRLNVCRQRRRKAALCYGLQAVATPFLWEGAGTLRASPWAVHTLRAFRLDETLLGAGLDRGRIREILQTATHEIRCVYYKTGMEGFVYLLFNTRLDLRSLGAKPEQDYYCWLITQALKAMLEQADEAKAVLNWAGSDHATDYAIAINQLVEQYVRQHRGRHSFAL
jgi:hypothetical protein